MSVAQAGAVTVGAKESEFGIASRASGVEISSHLLLDEIV